MSELPRRIGLMIGSEWSWPGAFIKEVNSREAGVVAELVKIGWTSLDVDQPYSLIIDRISHQMPYYRLFLKSAALNGCYVVNNPFTRAVDNRFFGISLAHKLGIRVPKTIGLPNKHVPGQTTPECFRNLKYPLEWDALIAEVGVPAILKNVRSGGRRVSFWVNTVDELIQRYDESDTATMMLQEIIPADQHVHCFVMGKQDVLAIAYSLKEKRYLADDPFANETIAAQVKDAARTLSRAYDYDFNMVEFVLKGEETPYLINPTNPNPDMDEQIMSPEQFDWCVTRAADMAIALALDPPTQLAPYPWTPAG